MEAKLFAVAEQHLKGQEHFFSLKNPEIYWMSG